MNGKELVNQVLFEDFVSPLASDFSIIEIEISKSFPKGSIEKVLYGIVSPARKLLSDKRPLFSVHSNECE